MVDTWLDQASILSSLLLYIFTHFLVHGLLITLMMEAARTSETLVNFYQTTQRYNSEDSRLCTHLRENLKSYY
jgi:hypothetical protein